MQNFRAKPGTRMAEHPEPELDDHLWTIAAARLLLPAAVHVQAPPNLAFDEFPRLLDAGIDDWGGVSPVTIDHVNPEAPWPELLRLEEATRSRGLELAARLPVYPEFVDPAWLDPRRPAHGPALVGFGRAGARGELVARRRHHACVLAPPRRAPARAHRRRARRGRARPPPPRPRRGARAGLRRGRPAPPRGRAATRSRTS